MKTWLAPLTALLGGCSTVVPQFDVPVNAQNQPTVRSIVERVRCELAEVALIGPNNFFVEQKAVVAVQLNLDVTASGGLAPSFEYLSGGPFTFTATPVLSQSRDQSFNQLLQFTMPEIATEFSNGEKLKQCKIGYTNLEGKLGIKESLLLALTAPNTNLDTPLSGTNGAYGGSVQFIVTKSIGAGPNWTLRNFVGPGKFASLSEVNTDKIVFAVAFPNKKETDTPQNRATAFINQININNLTVQLGNINNTLRTSQDSFRSIF